MQFRQYRPLEEDEFFCVGVDTSQGGNDYCCAQFVSQKHLDVPLVYHSNTTAIDMTNRLFPVLERIFDHTGVAPMVAYEANAGGVFELERLASLNRSNKFRIYTMKTYGNVENAASSKVGWSTNTATRPAMLADLKEAIDHRTIRVYDKPTISELYSFIINKQGKPEADVSAHDDQIMALAIAWQLQQTERPISLSNYQPYNKQKWSIS